MDTEKPMTERRTETASCRVTRSERALIEAATARAGEPFVSSWLRSVIRDRLEEEFGSEALGRARSRGEGRDGEGR